MGWGGLHLLFLTSIIIPTCSVFAFVMNNQGHSRNNEFFLVPSQAMILPSQVRKTTIVMGLSKRSEEKDELDDDLIQLVPSQIHSSSNNTKKESTRSNRNKKRGKIKSKGKNRTKLKRHGNVPDFAWRAIPMEHLRNHPNVDPLPLPESIKELERLEDIRFFRQESWQWDAVHDGRCTTSQAVAALGFLEPESSKILGIPKSWRRGAIGPFHRLKRPALRTLKEFNTVLCNHDEAVATTNHSTSELDEANIWTSSQHPFAAKYMIHIDDNDRFYRKQQIVNHYAKSASFDFSVRMLWGNAQEATSLLTALNYFQDENVRLQEIGMCGAGIQIIDCENLLLGATPDGLLCYPDGRIEVLEVKNHCPFLPSRNRNNNNNQQKSRFEIRHYNFKDHHGVLPHYVPQLMLEMYCVGPECKSAVMVRQSALSGAIVLRIKRDNDWIDEMLFWLKRFQIDHVDADNPPPENVFLHSGSKEDRIRYRKFLDWTKAIESNVEVLSHVPHGKIQRATGKSGAATDLFLD